MTTGRRTPRDTETAVSSTRGIPCHSAGTSAWTSLLALGALALTGCSQQTTFDFDSPTPSPTAVPVQDPHGEPPDDWGDCLEQYQGYYYNLPANHPDVEPEDLTLPEGTLPADLDWWDEAWFSYARSTATLDFGTDWFPVDTGLEADPAYFAVRFTAWIRAFSSTTVTLSLGSSDDAWVLIDNKVIASQPGIHDFDVQTFEAPLAAKQYPLDVYFAHRSMPGSGFRLLVLGGDVAVCYPEF